MASPHAGFAAVTLVSEELINRCLETYLNTFLFGITQTIERQVPVVVSGRKLLFRAGADAALISIRAQLKKNADSKIFLTFRFYADAKLEIFPYVDPVLEGPAPAPISPLKTYNPEIAIDVAVTASLIAFIQDDRFQFGVDLNGSSIDSLKVIVLNPGGLPDDYRSDLIKIFESPAVRSLLDAVIRPIASDQLRATPGTVPAYYEFHLLKPRQTNDPAAPREVWAHARIDISRLIWWPLDGRLAVAIDIPGYTSGNIHDLDSGYPMRDDIVSFTNLNFLESFLHDRILPQMGSCFVHKDIRIDQMLSFSFIHKDLINGSADYIQVVVNCAYSGISDVIVTADLLPYIFDGAMSVRFGQIDADLPFWVKALLFGFSWFQAPLMVPLALPPLNLMLPAIVTSMIRREVSDAWEKLNSSKEIRDGFSVRYNFKLPGTGGPTYQFDPTGIGFHCAPADRYAVASANIVRTSVPELHINFDDEPVTVNVHSYIVHQEVRRDGGLPQKIKAEMIVPRGLVQTRDPTLRIAFETYLNGKIVPAYTRDTPFFPGLKAGLVPMPSVLEIETARFVRPTKLDQEIRIACRLYYSLGGKTQELYNDSLYIYSVDPRPDDVKPYVQWAHRVTYWNGFRKRNVIRRSKIHKVPGKGGCRFSNQFLLPGMASPKFVSNRRLTDLPFEMRDIADNRKLVCDYCFFGGPDKTIPVHTKYDVTGAGGKRLKAGDLHPDR